MRCMKPSDKGLSFSKQFTDGEWSEKIDFVGNISKMDIENFTRKLRQEKLQEVIRKKEDRYLRESPKSKYTPWKNLSDKSILKKLKIEERFKVSKTFQALKAVDPYINEQIDKYSKYIDMGEKIFSQFGYLPIRSERNIFHYVRLGFALAKCYKEIEQGEAQEKTAPFFREPDWKLFHNRMLREYFFDLIKDRKGKILKETDDVICKVININGAEFGIEIIPAFGSLVMGERLYLSTKYTEEQGLSALREFAWVSVKQLSVRYNDNTSSIKIEDDIQGDFYSFNLCNEESDEIKEFQKKGYGRSILYYGPPGTGKTNLVRGICANLGGRSVKFPELDQINSKNILDVISFLKPNCIVFDDIDRCYNETTSEVLDALEKINQDSNLVFLATANRISNLDDAIIRPGRFDKIKEIKIMEREVLMKIIDNDLELFKIVETMPVACVKEITKRIEVFGREKALNNIQDIFDRVKNMKNSEYEFGGEDVSG